MILNPFQSTKEKKRTKRKKKNIYTGISSVRLHPPPAFSLSLFVFNNQYEEYWKKREKKRGKEKNLAPFWKVMSFFSSGI